MRYIIHTLGNIKIHADSEDLALLLSQSKSLLVFLKQGGVNPKHITAITEDVAHADQFTKLAGESSESFIARIAADKLPDAFQPLRTNKPQLTDGTNT